MAVTGKACVSAAYLGRLQCSFDSTINCFSPVSRRKLILGKRGHELMGI